MSLQIFLKELRALPCIPFATEMSLEKMPQLQQGIVTTVTEEIYWYYLEVLPPQWMSGGTFVFAEGCEAFKLFWQESSDAFFALRLSDQQTRWFSQLARVTPD